METLKIYLDIAWDFILANSDLVLMCLYALLFVCILILDIQAWNRLFKQYKKSLNENLELLSKWFWLSLLSLLQKDRIKGQDKKIVKLEKEIEALKNQKKTQKYYLEKRYLALETAILMYYWDKHNIYNNIRSTYLILNKNTLSKLQEENEMRKKNLKEKQK